MQKLFLLMAQYETPVVPVERVARDHFALDKNTFLRKVGAGDIRLPVIRMEKSQKGARGVHVAALAQYIDERHEAALKEMRQLFG